MIKYYSYKQFLYQRIVYTSKAHGTIDTNKYIKSEYPFWIPAINNICIDVGTNGSLTGEEWKKADGADRIKTAWFTKPGDKTKAPFIIAVPTTQMWTAEGADFPIGTFTELE